MRVKHAKTGVTLIELIVAIAVFTIVLTVTFLLFSFGNRTFSSGDTRYDIQTSLRSAVNYVTEQVRYSTDIEIINSGSVPDQSLVPQYINYLYYDNATNSIIHLNKYFIKSIPVVNVSGTNTGSINFNSVSPYNTIDFNIYAKKKLQEYNINGNLELLNIKLGTAKKVIGTSTPPAAQTGSIIKFKTANNYISEILMPVATIGSTNETKKFTVKFDRSILSVEIITSQTSGVTSPNATFSGDIVTVTTNGTSDGAKVVVRVTFSDYEAYGNIYEYTAVYDSSSKWSIL